MIPHVVAEPPAGWSAAMIEAPTLAESAGAVMSSWTARRSSAAEGGAALVTGCVATPIPGWVDDMRPAVEARTTALAGAVAAKIVGAPIDVRPGFLSTVAHPHGLFLLRPTSDLQGRAIGSTRTFLGFDERRVFTCFAVCANLPGATITSHERCSMDVLLARLEDSRPPPEPGLALRGATWAVHHPRPFAFGAGLGVIGLGILAVSTRRRPRSRTSRPTAEPHEAPRKQG